MTKIVAWDPGASGAFVWVRRPGVTWDKSTRQWRGVGLAFIKPNTSIDNAMILIYKAVPLSDLIVYEEQSGFGGSEFKSTAFHSFGKGFGRLLGAIEMSILTLKRERCCYPKLVGILPQRWQKVLNLPKLKPVKGESKNDKAKRRTAWKRQLRDEAIRLYPDCPFKITLDNCDALLLLHYAQTHLVTGN